MMPHLCTYMISAGLVPSSNCRRWCQQKIARAVKNAVQFTDVFFSIVFQTNQFANNQTVSLRAFSLSRPCKVQGLRRLSGESSLDDIINWIMLKALKEKKTGKGEAPKESKKEKQPKAETKKKEQQEEEDTNDALVDIKYDEKEKNKTKNAKKVQASKLEEKEIDTTNIKIEKKEEKKEIKSWVVNEQDIKDLLVKKDFDATKHQTEFESLTDHNLNKQLQEKAKKEAEENKKPQIEQKNGLKFAPLDNTKVNVNEPTLSFNRKPAVDVNASLTPNIPIAQTNLQFTNSKINAECNTLEKSAQQLREEEIERKMQEGGGGIVLKGSKNEGWLGSKKKVEEPKQEIKISGWAMKAMEEGNVAPAKFAPLNLGTQERRMERQEQQFVFTSKKEQEERRKKREAEEAAKNTITKQ